MVNRGVVMPRPEMPIGVLLLAVSVTLIGPAVAIEEFSMAVCSRQYTEVDANKIVREVFDEKYQRLLKDKGERLMESGTLTQSFVERNEGVRFIVCDNPG